MNVEVWVHDHWLSEPLSSLMAVSVAGAKSLQNVWEWCATHCFAVTSFLSRCRSGAQAPAAHTF